MRDRYEHIDVAGRTGGACDRSDADNRCSASIMASASKGKASFGATYTLLRILLLFAVILSGSAIACTIGVIAGEVTTDGRPMLWKNRDVHNRDQEYRFFDEEPYSFVSNTYNGETHRAWAGANQVGFAIINSDVYNLGSNGYTGHDDGEIMKWALQHCETVDDFQAFLDSTDIVRRRSCHNYACIDAYGGAAMFEVARASYVRLDAVDEGGYVIRANYAMSGDMGGRLAGLSRYEQAQSVIDRRADIDIHFVIDSLASNVGTMWFSPYPLPYDNPESSMPRGYINTYSSINREQTSSASVIVGRRPGESTIAYPVLWGFFGQPILGMPFPLWPCAEGVHPSVDGSTRSILCHQAMLFTDTAYDLPSGDYLNTYTVSQYHSYFGEARTQVFETAEDRMNHRIDSVNSPDYLRALQDSLTAIVEEKYTLGVELFVREDNIKPDQLRLTISPNPFNSAVSIALSQPLYNLDARIFNLQGRQTAVLHTGTSHTPIQTLTWTPSNSNNPSGVYMLRITTPDNGLVSERLLYIK